ncbi:hypothetical protein [Mesorhizobium huakuii]|uniref:Uncharacterized protein n=1 Tax=Mesorhizobium huakuii TaxID=28104 RepID=A0A7G6SZA8_9HYPH|nr:hypothetical protein [Mesorhizobium huakuii]QND59840.1 hypothetical protein HB778_27250 [Mesorhizobium huakuii]
MAPLPKGFDAHSFWILDLLHRGKRKEAKERIIKVLATGRAGPETQKIAAEVFAPKRGRQPYGAKHLWFEIGTENDIMRGAGVAYERRMDDLGGRYMLAKTQIEIAIAKYEAAMIEIRAENEANYK